MKQNLFKSALFFSSTVWLVLSFIVAPAVNAAGSCSVTTKWRDQNKQDLLSSTITAPTNSTYYAIAVYNNCQNYSPSITLYGPNYGTISGTDVLLGNVINQALEERNSPITFSQAGGYSFKAVAYVSAFNQTSAKSSIITASVQSGTPAGNQTSLPSGKKYACKDGNGTYVCGDKADLADVKETQYVAGGPCDTYQTSYPQVDPSWCGKTDAEIKAAATSGGSGTTPCTGTGPGSCTSGQTCTNGTCVTNGMQTNGGNELINPLGQDSLTGVFLNIVKGFLAIVAIWAVLFVIVGGFQLVMAAGNEETYLKAKKTIMWAILGLVVAVLSFSIVAIVQNLLGVTIKPLG